MKYDFDITAPREGTNTIKFDLREAVFGRGDVIPMWIADMDFACAPFIREAVIKRAEYPVYAYDFRPAGFFEAVAGWLGRRNGWRVDPEWVVFVPGVVAGLSFGVMAFSDPGEGVLIQPPVYPPFYKVVADNGRKLFYNPLRQAGGRAEIDFEDLEVKLQETRMMILCNPQNPTGRVLSRGELERIAALCVDTDTLLLSDEIHSDLIFKPNKHLHIASLSPGIASRTVTFVAPSKTFNVAGLSTAVAIIPDPALREKFTSTASRLHVGDGNTFGPVAFEAAYRMGDEWLDQLNDYLKGNYEFVRDFLAERLPSVKLYRSEGTFLLWLDFSGWGMAHSELRRFLVDRAGVGLGEGLQYGREGVLHMRMNIGTSRAVVRQALEQIAGAYNAMK